ncbi:hypothetical protein GJAV_G00166960 [Gymnothorax javanicus]|nr:hypothetical protein GJAV_G00166960 [Gymnothorax javanicus]
MTESCDGSPPLGSQKNSSVLDAEGHSECPEAPSVQSPFSWSLQKVEALLRTRLNPGLCWLLKQKSNDDASPPENGDSFVSYQNLTSHSSRYLQQLELCVYELADQWQVQYTPSGVQCRCVGVSSSEHWDFQHHPVTASFGQHYARLQNLLEDRARLLFFHEFIRRCQAASTFISHLVGLIERGRTSPDVEGRSQCSPWGYSVEALCEELRVHLGHWGHLRAKARAERWLRTGSFWSSRTAASVQQTLTLLGLQALVLMHKYLEAAVASLAWATPEELSARALEDTLAGLEIFNNVVAERGNLLGERVCPAPVTATRLLHVLAEHRGRAAAKAFHQWATGWRRPLPLLCPSPLRSNWEQFDWTSSPVLPPPQVETSVPAGASCPLPAFVKEDAKFIERILRALLSSTILQVHKVPSQPLADLSHMADSSRGHHAPCSGAQDGHDTRRCKSVQWRDTRKSGACAALVNQYRRLLWKEVHRALLSLIYYPTHNSALESVNQCRDQAVFLFVTELRSACRKVSLPVECEGLLNNLVIQIICKAAFSQWDEVLCRSLATGAKDKCLPYSEGGNPADRTSTAEHLLHLLPPLHTSLNCLKHSGGSTEILDTRTLRSLQMLLLSRAVVSVHSSAFWVMTKAYQFLCSWDLNKFLLVTQGDLKVLKAAMESLAQCLGTLGQDGNCKVSPIVWQTSQFTCGVKNLQNFSELVLRIFSKDCKKMAEEIFEQTMPSGKYWRITCKAELPSNPSDYAAFAAQNTIGQVLEGVRPLPDEARIPVLTEAMTAFMEAWMEHILKQKIKFSLQGALQLKQDFDLIRDLIQSEEYRLSDEIHQHLLSLPVFHQVDSAVMCLLQQPVAKPSYSNTLVDPGSGSLNSLESMDIQAARNQALSEAEESLAPRLLAASLPESYLALSQQEWLALRIHGGTRWKCPGLPCLSKSEH